MRDDDFEWDDAKAAANLATHDVSFEAARLAIADAFAVAREDPRQDYGEDRFILLGMANNLLLHVAYTIRHERSASFLQDWPSRAKDDGTMSKTAKRAPKKEQKHDWSRVDAMTAKSGTRQRWRTLMQGR